MRHPLVRLLSAYRNKFVEPNWLYPKRVGTHIIKTYRKNPTNEALEKGHDVQFSEFLQFLLDLGKHNRSFDKHWDTYDRLCDPCTIRYNAVMKQETLSQDFQPIKDKIYPGIDAANMPPMYTHFTNDEMIQANYRDLNPISLHELIELYKYDFTMYGYPTDIDSMFV